jgi:hypothetical protein
VLQRNFIYIYSRAHIGKRQRSISKGKGIVEPLQFLIVIIALPKTKKAANKREKKENLKSK